MSRRETTTPATNEMALLMQRMSNEKAMKADFAIIKEYVVKDIFPFTVFVFDERALAEEQLLHKSFLEKFGSVESALAGWLLKEVDEVDRKTYMKLLWTRLTQDKKYRIWLAQRCSNIYQAVHDKFDSKYYGIVRWLESGTKSQHSLT